MKRLLVITLIVSACTSSGGTDTTSSSAGPTTTGTTVPRTTTTIDNDTCGEVAEDAADFLEDLIDALDEAGFRAISDPALWPDDLVNLQISGQDLDFRATALRCDPGSIQAAALREAKLDPESRIASLLLRLLGGEAE